MNTDEMSSAESGKYVRKGSIEWSIPKGSAEVVVEDGPGDYPRLDHRAAELKRARSAVDIALPWLVWPVFVVSVVVGASSAAVILEMKRAAPISLSGWRHQVSALAMLPFFLFEWNRMAKFERSKTRSFSTVSLYFASSLALSCHFAFYLWSLANTSLVHCLFLVCMTPIFVAIYTKLTGGEMLLGEVIGTVFGLLGVGVLAAGTSVEGDQQSSYIGDFVAILAAISMAGYLIVGRKLRSWMPLFVYQFPVAVLAAILLGTVGLLWEGWNESDVGEVSGLFGWLRKEYFFGTIYMGLGPGIIGHAGYSFVMKYSSPLVMPTGLSLQPILGSLLAWALGESPTPGLCSCVGGAVTLTGTLFVSCASANRKVSTIMHYYAVISISWIVPVGIFVELPLYLCQAKVENKEDEYKQPAADDEEGQQGTRPLLQN